MYKLLTSKTLIIALVMGLLFVMLHLLADLRALAYLRGAISEGQWWRLYTGHFVHFTLYHALMNAAGLVFVAFALFFRQSFVVLIGLNILLPLCISAGLWLWFPSTEQYRGYSGVIYGLIAAGLVLEWADNKGLYTIGLLLLGGKIVYEQFPNYDVNYLMAEIGVPVAVEAHMFGFIAGTAGGLLLCSFNRLRQPGGNRTKA